MESRITENARPHPRVTPLLMNCFSRLQNSTSLNRTSDSGYDSSCLSSNSSTPSANCDSFGRYSSTPIMNSSLVLPHQPQRVLLPSADTPVCSVSEGHRKFSSDRIPCRRAILSTRQEEEISSNDFLSNLIQRSATPAVKRILQYLDAVDLLKLCQVSDIYCQAVCNHQECLRRLSKYMILAHQNCENRVSPSLHLRSSGRILREIQNIMNVEATAGMILNTSPSALETIDLDHIPRMLRLLLDMTKNLTESQCVVICHSCRRLAAIRQSQKSTECAKCTRRVRNTSRLVRKRTTLFASAHR